MKKCIFIFLHFFISYDIFSQLLSGGNNHSLALCEDGTVYAWGDNAYGQLGDNTNISKEFPVKVLGLSNIISISAGGEHSLALKNDGTVWAWGYNSNGQLGDSTTINRSVPFQIAGISDVSAIDGGALFSLAIKNDGSCWAWGSNGSGQLGDSTIVDKLVPIQVVGPGGLGNLTNGAEVSCGTSHSLVLRQDSTIWAFGSNSWGQLGDNTTTYKITPTQVVDSNGIGFFNNTLSISNGLDFSIALKTNGTVFAWGSNVDGQLGNNSITDTPIPVQVLDSNGNGFLNGVIAISAGHDHTLVLKNDSTIWSFGWNDFGQLGDNTTIQRWTPVQVVDTIIGGFFKNVTSISSGYHHSLALKNDGTVWAWGMNNLGQLGDSTNIQRNAPVKVTNLCALQVAVEHESMPGRCIPSPNPFSGSTFFSFGSVLKHATLKIYDLLGKESFVINFSGSDVVMQKGNLLEGIYFFTIIDDEKVIAMGKLLVK